MTKVEAIKKVMQDNDGCVFLCDIYEQAGKYYKGVDAAKDWRRIATRYDRNVVVYLASLFIVATVTWWL